MSKIKLLTVILITAFLTAFVLPVLAVTYNPGVETGQYVKYGNFVGVGQGVESFNDYDWLRLQVTNVSGKSVTLFSTSQYKNGTAIVGMAPFQFGTLKREPKTAFQLHKVQL